MRDLEEDEELRANVQLFKAAPTKAAAIGDEMDTDGEGATDAEDDEDDDEMPKINVDELLDEMEGLNIVSVSCAQVWLYEKVTLKCRAGRCCSQDEEDEDLREE